MHHRSHNQGGLHWGGKRSQLSGGLLLSGVCIRGSASTGICIWGVCIRGICIQRKGGLHPGEGGLHPGEEGLHTGGIGQTTTPPKGYYGIRSTSGRYASYWNAFLFFIFLVDINVKSTLGPAHNEFGHYENPAITSRIFFL